MHDCPLDALFTDVLTSVPRPAHIDLDARLLTPVPAVVRLDPEPLREILVRLIGHAVGQTRQGTVMLMLRMETREEQDWLSVAVVDSGSGMSADEIARADAPDTPEAPIGLTGCRALATTLGGSLTIQSAANRGSTVTLKIPVVIPPDAPDLSDLTLPESEPAPDTELLRSTLADVPSLQPVVQRFVTNLPERIAGLQAAWAQSDRSHLRELAHQMKGAAGSYGFAPISEMAARLEEAIRSGASDVEARYETLLQACGRATAL